MNAFAFGMQADGYVMMAAGALLGGAIPALVYCLTRILAAVDGDYPGRGTAAGNSTYSTALGSPNSLLPPDRASVRLGADAHVGMGDALHIVRPAMRGKPANVVIRRFMSRLQEIATLPLDVVDDATPSRLRCRLMEINPGWHAMKGARSVINDSASACFPARAR
jgi:hypothetical protein